ncbi:MAG: hypothetical protein ABL933_06540 [Methyloglobulus sp.]|nr:hypothetical protein [Methyloglobulus sp.]
MNNQLKLLCEYKLLRCAIITFSFFSASTAQAVTYYKITDLSVKFPSQANSSGFTPINLSDTGLVLGYKTVPATQISPTKFVFKIYNSNTGKLSSPLTADGNSLP